MADHLRPMEELLRIPILGIQDAIVVPAVLADQFELKPELLDFEKPRHGLRTNLLVPLRLKMIYGVTSTQIDAITVLTKQVEALEYHFASMRENYDHNQETSNQLMQNQMGQMEEIFQERQSCVLSSNTDLRAELHVITSIDGLTLDGSFIPHSLVYQEKEQEPKTITEVVEIPSSQSTPLIPPPETPPLSAPKTKENLEPNPHHPLIPYPSRLQEEKFQALENPTGRADHFVYRIDIVDSLCDKLHIENNSYSGNPTLSPDPDIESLSPSLTPFRDIDLLLEETDTFLSLDDSIPPGIDNGIYDSEGDILFLEELLNDEIPRDLPSKELKDDEPSTTKCLIEKPLEIDNEIYDSEGDILFLENLLKDEEIKLNPLKASDDSIPIPRVSVTPLDSLDSFFDSYDTSYTNPSKLDSEYTLNYDNLIFNIQNEHCDKPKTETIMDEVHSTVQIPSLLKGLTFDKSMQDIIL
ncbi:hypothetical protein Tco_1101646 [Tanacetum coccineum]